MKYKFKQNLCTFLAVIPIVVQLSVPQLVSAETKQYVKEQIYFEDFNNISDATLASWNEAYVKETAQKGRWYTDSTTTPVLDEHTNASDKALSMEGHKQGDNNFFYFTLPGDIEEDGIAKYEISFDYYANGSWCDWFYLKNSSDTNAYINMNYSQGWNSVTMTIDLENTSWFVGNAPCKHESVSSVLNGEDLVLMARLHGNANAGNKIKFDNFKVYKFYENVNYDIYDEAISLYDKFGIIQEDLNNVDIKLGEINIDFGSEELEVFSDECITLDGNLSYETKFENNKLSILITSQKLEYNTTYTFTLDGLQTKSGKVVTKKEFSFKTLENVPIINDGQYIEYEDFEDWTNDTCLEHYDDKYITLGGFRTWTATGIVNGKDGGKALTPMYGNIQASRGLQYYFVPKLERDNFTIDYDFYTGDIENFSGMTLGVYRTKDGYGMNMIPYDGMTALGTKTWGHVKIDFAAGTGAWTVKITNDLDEDVYNNSGTWTDSTVNLFEWVFNSIDVSKNNADVNVPKIDNFIVNAIYLSAPKLSPKSVSVYEGDIIQPLDSVSPSSNKIIVDFGQRMMPDDMTKGNIYITESGDPNPITTTDRYSNGKYELSPVDYLVSGKKYTVHINKCRNVNDMEMSQDYSIDFTVGKGTVSTELFDILQNGSAIDSVSKLSPGNANLQILYNNSTGEKYLLHYILAFYKGNELVYSKYDTAELGDNSAGQIEEINVLIPEMAEEYDEADIIALDSFNGMLPISKALVLK